MGSKISDLIPIIQMGLDIELSKLRKIQNEIRALYEEIDAIKSAKVQRINNLNSDRRLDFAYISGADEKWLIWQRKQISQMNTKIAALMAEKDIQINVAKISFGKRQVVRKITMR